MSKICRIIKNDIYSLFSINKLIFTIIIFTIISITTMQNISDIWRNDLGIYDICFLAFLGPQTLNFKIIEVLKWIIPHIFLYYFISDFIDLELRERNIYLIYRIKSLNTWLKSKIISLFIITFFYFFIGFIIILALAIFKFNVKNNLSYNLLLTLNSIKLNDFNIIYIIGNIFILMWFSNFLLVLIEFFISITTKNPIISLIITSILDIISVYMGYINLKLVKWLPTNQGIISRHSILDKVQGMSFTWSYIYLSLGSLFIIFICYKYIQNKGILQ